MPARSAKRIAASRVHAYILQDAARLERLRPESRNALDRQVRWRELLKSEEKRVARNGERRERFARVEANDRETMRLFRLTLEDLVFEELRELDRAPIRDVNDPTALDPAPPWSSGLDPATREGLAVMAALIESGGLSGR